MLSVKELQEQRIDWCLNCHDRIYLNLYSPILNSPPGVSRVIRDFLEWDVPHPMAFKSVRDDYVAMVECFAEENGLEIFQFDKKNQNSKEEIAAEHLKNFPWDEGVFFIGNRAATEPGKSQSTQRQLVQKRVHSQR